MASGWRKSTPTVVARFDAALPTHPRLERRQMFGYAAAFVNGHYFAGLHEDDVIVRLPGGRRDRLPALAGAAPFDPRGTGRGMRDWWIVPAAVAGDAGRLRQLLAAALAEVVALPPKR